MKSKIFTLLILAAAVVSCGKGDDPVVPRIDDATPSVVIPANAAVNSTQTATFTSTVPWSIELATKAAPSWLTVSPVSGGAGTATLTITVNEENTTYEDRSAEITVKAGTATPVKIDVTQKAGDIIIEDANFKAYLLANFDTDGNGGISAAEAAEVGYIDVYSLQITSLKGIEAFVNLERLYCHENRLTSLDVGNCTALEVLVCFGNQLATLDVSNCTALTQLDCIGNKLTSLDVGDCTALTHLWCGGNLLKSLDVSDCTALSNLDCRENQLESLDVRNNMALASLRCSQNPGLSEVWVKQGHSFTDLEKESYTAIVEK